MIPALAYVLLSLPGCLADVDDGEDVDVEALEDEELEPSEQFFEIGPRCQPGFSLCFEVNRFQCRNLEVDENNCGGCGVTCFSGDICLAGICTDPGPLGP
ncbi:MAG: hypothetical protein AAGN82_00810 [Myxococcota bacterium]